MVKDLLLPACNQAQKHSTTGFCRANMVVSAQPAQCKCPQMMKWNTGSKKYAQVVAQSMEGVFAQTDSEHHLGDKCLVLQQIA